MKEIREPDPQSSGCGIGCVVSMVVPEYMQLGVGKKEAHCHARSALDSSIGTYHQPEVADSAMQEQIRSEIFDQLHLGLHVDRSRFLL